MKLYHKKQKFTRESDVNSGLESSENPKENNVIKQEE